VDDIVIDVHDIYGAPPAICIYKYIYPGSDGRSDTSKVPSYRSPTTVKSVGNIIDTLEVKGEYP
jgi:hypothetical protein